MRHPRPPEKLETQNAERLRVVPFQFLISLLHFRSGRRANHVLRTRRERRGCNPCVACSGSLSLLGFNAMRTVFSTLSALAILTLSACRTSSSRETYQGEFTREFGSMGLAFGTIKALNAGDTNKAYHWNLIFLNESITRAEELARRAPDERQQMLMSMSKTILSHLETSKERTAQTWRSDYLALEITKVLGRTLKEEDDLRRVEALRRFFASKFIEERKAMEDFNKEFPP
jgi:hypothetical protein